MQLMHIALRVSFLLTAVAVTVFSHAPEPTTAASSEAKTPHIQKVYERAGHGSPQGFDVYSETPEDSQPPFGDVAVREHLAPLFSPPLKYRNDLGDYRSPLKFRDGSSVQDASGWKRRREEILQTWHQMMGPWPPSILKPRIEYLAKERRDGITEHHVNLEVAPGRMNDDAYLLLPDGSGPFPAVLVVFYDAKTGIGKGRLGLLDFALQLAQRGFVALSLGSDPATSYPDKKNPQLQPLSFHAYMAANSYRALANLPQVNPQQIGVLGHSYGGKWAMFASCLFDKFAWGVWSDPGIVFDESHLM
jgi:hypothetical protein